jgi:hypothetical protein
LPGNPVANVLRCDPADYRIGSWIAWSGLTMLLPYVDQTPLYDSIDFGIDSDEHVACYAKSPGNRVANRTYLTAFTCPSDPFGGGRRPQTASGPTSYALSAGPVADWNDEPPVGPFSFRSSIRRTDIKDGASNTILASDCKIGVNSATRDDTWRVVDAGLLRNPRITSTSGYRDHSFDNRPADLQVLKQFHADCLAKKDSTPAHGGSDDAGR